MNAEFAYCNSGSNVAPLFWHTNPTYSDVEADTDTLFLAVLNTQQTGYPAPSPAVVGHHGVAWREIYTHDNEDLYDYDDTHDAIGHFSFWRGDPSVDVTAGQSVFSIDWVPGTFNHWGFYSCIRVRRTGGLNLHDLHAKDGRIFDDRGLRQGIPDVVTGQPRLLYLWGNVVASHDNLVPTQDLYGNGSYPGIDWTYRFSPRQGIITMAFGGTYDDPAGYIDLPADDADIDWGGEDVYHPRGSFEITASNWRIGGPGVYMDYRCCE